MAIKNLDELGYYEKQAALEAWYKRQADDDMIPDKDYFREDLEHVGAVLGFRIDDSQWSGFACQGDGASFTGVWRSVDAAGAVAGMAEHAPLDETLTVLAVDAAELAAKIAAWTAARDEAHEADEDCPLPQSNGDEGWYKIARTDYYYSHENTIRAEPSDYAPFDAPELSDEVTELARRLSKWYYRSLEAEYDYQTGEKGLQDAINDGFVAVDADGSLAYTD